MLYVFSGDPELDQFRFEICKKASFFVRRGGGGGSCYSAQTIYFVCIPLFHELTTKQAVSQLVRISWPWDDFAAPAHFVGIYFKFRFASFNPISLWRTSPTSWDNPR
jgi:hypothetical protein